MGLIGCDSNRIYEKHEGIPEIVWAKDNIVTFKFDIEDVESSYKLAIAVRHTEFFESGILSVR